MSAEQLVLLEGPAPAPTPGRPVAAKLEAGTRVGFYEVKDCLGTGGFGAVYRVTRDSRTYALKVSKQRLADMEPDARRDFEGRFSRELAVLNSLRHPNVVRAYAHDVWPDPEGHPYVVMDLVEGQRFFDWRKASRPSLRVICRVAGKLALALQAMHRLEVFHRDLKSENVLVRGTALDAEPVLIDFGMARPLSSETVTRQGLWMGTLKYLAPEYVGYWDTPAFQKGQPFEWAPTTDLYAVGVMLYQALCGEAPLKAVREAEMMATIKRVAPRSPSTVNPAVPEALSALIARLLEKDPAKRPQSGQELADELRSVDSQLTADASWDVPFVVPGDSEAPPPAPPDALAEAGAMAAAPTADARGRPQLEARKEVFSGVKGAPAPKKKEGTPVMERVPVAAAEQAQPPPFRPPVEDDRKPLSSELRKAKEQEAGPEPRAMGRELASRVDDGRNGRHSWKWVVVAAVLVPTTGVLALAASDRPKPVPQPASLLKRVEEQALAADGGGEATVSLTMQEPAPSGAPLLVQAEPMVLAARVRPGNGDRPTVNRAAPGGSGLAQAEINRLLAETYALDGGRPTIPGPDGNPVPGTNPGLTLNDKRLTTNAAPSSAPHSPSWLHTAERLDAPPPVAATLGIAMGAHIRARLKTNLDSRTAGEGFVEATLERPYFVNGELKLPPRTMAYGKASAPEGRFTVHFTMLVLPGGRELPIDALAYDLEERKPGLKPSRSTTNDKRPTTSKVSQVAKDTGQVLVGAIAQGDVASQAAQRAAQDTLADDNSAQATSESSAYLDAGLDFDLFVTRAL